ncbi:heme-binding protein 1-like [Gadus morhua]|uniref:Heme-binding protein 1-like n=1 Tax=Gadus morhua TaxID=8049 RepID=A0A8C5CFE1_GADMO|nr:heme-binding protein 1-like [Gadus morhua]
MMDRKSCSMNGGAGHLRHGPGLGFITLEDLNALTDENVESDMTSSEGYEREGTEIAEDDNQDRLLNYWQNIGRGHQIDIPREMAQPIQQLTADIESSPHREQIPFTLVARKEQGDGVACEKRVMDTACWACITVTEDTYEKSICAGFMSIMRYICQQNTSGRYLGMTVPIVTVVRTDDALSRLSREVRLAYCLPSCLQDQPPLPTDPDITLETWPATVLHSRAFTGPTNEETVLHEIRALAEILASPNLLSNTFVIAGYTSLAATHRHNEVWLLERQ